MTTTSAPRSLITRAQAAPMPVAPPTMSARFPSNLNASMPIARPPRGVGSDRTPILGGMLARDAPPVNRRLTGAGRPRRSVAQDPASVDADRLPGDPGPGVGDQQQERPDEVLGRAFDVGREGDDRTKSVPGLP